ncbi:peptide-methionine (S)-S-oxide reductase MsrA [Lacticaseibacillus hulanensis]|uniref:peptide-methionine (S)-S-oxide reductase MsrA n=1 Tax=Lacticaseibacillus hulanensis TaxID=2493111 RepID=UPI000FD98A40|nr:peptide-methionine (S)-S-oxide reductase MsrA [Lacticaseibacillus hulanensis]
MTTPIISTIDSLIANRATTAWEKEQLTAARTALSLGDSLGRTQAQLEFALRPLAMRNNLTPDVADLYFQLTNNHQAGMRYDYSTHKITDPENQERALFAGGCFWCMVEPFETMPGIVSVQSGYTGGHVDAPTYAEVSSGRTGHVEAVEIIYDKRQISYKDLLNIYWQISDPTDNAGQFADRGENYRPVIFWSTKPQMEQALASRQKLSESPNYRRPIVTAIRPASKFWPAENYHQQFYKKFPKRYSQLHRERKRYLFYQRLLARLTHLAGALRKK